uniref:Uncharacterized protein n=1 Tax=Oryza glumipatula TaxID=40148 RepID=A0A0E0B9N6_9ORYZ
MESDDEFNEFVMNELIDPSSLDEEHDLFFGAAQMIIEESVNNPGRIGSVQGHEVVHRDRLLWHNLLYKDYFSDNPTFGANIFRRRITKKIKNKETHTQLQADLIEHLWQNHGDLYHID